MALDGEFDFWQADGCAVRIDYSRTVMEELRLAACDGFNRLSHGGVEIGGVLFGVRDPDAVRILAHRALACEYAFGPSFTLWDNDRRALEVLLASPNTDSSLAGMQPVGWYHSHTRSEILLSEKDLQLYHQYFPEIWQIALVLRPYRFDPVRAGFFFREPDGSVQAASSRREFIVKPVGGKPVDGKASALAETAPAPASPALPEPAPVEAAPQSAPAIDSHPRSELVPHTSPVVILHNPRRAGSSQPQRRWALSATVSAAVVAVALAGLLFSIGGSHNSAGLTVRALDEGGQLRIDWNRNSSVIEQSQGGAVEIEDGSLKVHHELSQEHLRAGSITYLPTSGNVLVRLLVRGTDQSTFTEMSRFLGPPPGTTIATGASKTAVPVDAGFPDQPPKDLAAEDLAAKKDATNAASVVRQPEPEIQHAETRAASARARRQLVLPPAHIPRPTEPLLPAPPMITANTGAPIAAFPRVPDSMGIPRPPVSAPLNLADQGPLAGKIIWTGKLGRSGTIQILGNRASQGHLTGGLPGGPVRVQVFPSELTPEGLRIFTAEPQWISAPEAPGSQNGWNRTVYVLNARKAGEVAIAEAPGQQNAWNRLTLRAERGDHSIIVLLWERIAAESKLHAAGNQ